MCHNLYPCILPQKTSTIAPLDNLDCCWCWALTTNASEVHASESSFIECNQSWAEKHSNQKLKCYCDADALPKCTFSIPCLTNSTWQDGGWYCKIDQLQGHVHMEADLHKQQNFSDFPTFLTFQTFRHFTLLVLLSHCVLTPLMDPTARPCSFQSQNVSLVQERHPYTGNRNSESLGTVKARFYIVKVFLGRLNSDWHYSWDKDIYKNNPPDTVHPQLMSTQRKRGAAFPQWGQRTGNMVLPHQMLLILASSVGAQETPMANRKHDTPRRSQQDRDKEQLI